MEINKQVEEVSFGEFMKLSLEGFSWAENICQRVENICMENNMVQNPGKYVNVVGEHFRKATGTKGEELDKCDLLEKHSTCACEETELTENLFLEHHTVPSVMENLGPGFRKDTSDETFLTCGKLDRSFSTDDSLSEHGDDRMVDEEENVSVENYACERPEDHSVKVLNLVQIPKVEDTSFLLESDGSELAPKKGPIETEKSMKNENLSNFSREEFGNPSIFSLKNEDLGEFEDVILEDDFKAVKVENDWDDIIKTEIALISSLAAKKQSSKTKLKKLFSSRWRPSRRRALVTKVDLHSATSSDLDWELL